MSALVICEGGATEELTALVAAWNGALGTVFRLYTLDTVLTRLTVLADFTEADFDGYAPITVADWDTPVGTGTGAATTAPVTTPITWTYGSGGPLVSNTIYGYYVTDGAGNLLWAERYDGAPVTMDTPGQTFSVVPQRAHTSQFP